MIWLIYHLFALIDAIVYGLASSLFRIIFDLAETPFFKEQQIQEIANRVYVVLGVLMLFKLVMAAIQYMINPDTFDDKEKGMGGLLQKIAVSLGLIVITPAVFNFLVSVQGPIIKTLPSIILGSSPSETVNDKTIGFDLSFSVLSTFVRPRVDQNGYSKGGSVSDLAGKNKGVIHDIWSFQEHVTDGCPSWILEFGNMDNCVYDYKIIISTISGAFLCYMLLTMVLDISVRTIKLGIIQMLAPIPISSYVFSKDKLNKFVKTSLTVYTDLFIRMAIVYFIIFAIQTILETGVLGFGVANTGDWFRDIVVSIALIFGLLMFASKAPKFLTELLGLPDVGSGDLADMFKPAWQRVGGSASLGASIGAWRNAKDYGEPPKRRLMRALTAGAHATGARLRDIASGKSLEESYKSARDAAFARTNKNLEYANRFPDRKKRRRQIWQERYDAYTGVMTGGKKANATIEAANTLLEGRNHSWSRAEAKVLESPGKYTRTYTFTGSDGAQHTFNVAQMVARMKALEGGATEAYVGELTDLTNNRQDIIDVAKQEFIEKSFSEVDADGNLVGDGQQRNVFAEDMMKFMRTGGDTNAVNSVLFKGEFKYKDSSGQMQTINLDMSKIVDKINAKKPLSKEESEALSYYIAKRMNNEAGDMRRDAIKEQTTAPKDS